jgi:hypothetical protein
MNTRDREAPPPYYISLIDGQKRSLVSDALTLEDRLTPAQLALFRATGYCCEVSEQRLTSDTLRIMRDRWEGEITAALKAVPDMESELRDLLENFTRNIYTREMFDVLIEFDEIAD